MPEERKTEERKPPERQQPLVVTRVFISEVASGGYRFTGFSDDGRRTKESPIYASRNSVKKAAHAKYPSAPIR